MGNVSSFLVYVAATCTVGVCVSVHRLKRLVLEQSNNSKTARKNRQLSCTSLFMEYIHTCWETNVRARRDVPSHYRMKILRMTSGHKQTDSTG